MITELVCVLIVLSLFYELLTRKPTNFPPGPKPYPFIGNLPTVGGPAHIHFQRLSKQYGPIVGVKFGPINAICVHGTELIKEAFSEPTFNGRQISEARNFLFGDRNGILASVGHTWTEQRRFALRYLRDFGFGKSSMEEMIMEEVKEFTEWLKIQNGKPVALRERFSLAVVNSLWQIVSGERFSHDDAHLHKIMDGVKQSAEISLDSKSPRNFFLFYYPKIGKYFGNWSGWNNLVASKIPLYKMLTETIKDHKDTFQDDSSRDFIDVFLKEIKKTTDPGSSFYTKVGENSLRSVMEDLFLAGTNTTSATLGWFFVYLLHNPRVEKKVHEELDRVVGRTRHVNLSDRKRLVYTEAVILETFRMSSIIPVSIPHSATENVKFHGYNIPKGTAIFGNIWANHHDPEVWGEDVEEFRPERFLSPDETTVIRHEALIPFSIGRRVCIGETLAKDSVFLFAANLALNFQVSAGPQLTPLKSRRTLTLDPISSTVVMKERPS